jgi:hypothetical protein
MIKLKCLEKKFSQRYLILSSNNLISHHQQLLTILLQIKLINLRKISHNLVSQNIFMNCRLNNKKIIEQVWKNINEKRSKSRKIIQRMLKIDEAIRASIKTYILWKLMFVFIKEILQVLIIKYKKIDDQIKKQIHEKFQTLKQSSFKNQIEIWITNWENLKSRILTFDIKNFFDFETMFVEKFLIVNRKWISTFCDN